MHRYGFNGKENDNEVKGEGNQQDYGMRVYDGRLGKFLSLDPLTSSYPWYTPYSFSGNNPIFFIDLDGMEEMRPGIHFDPITQTGSASYPMLTKSQWKTEDRSSATKTFASAARYNTFMLNSKVYEPVNQIHKYYVWAGREMDKLGANIKFFHAARDVTSIWGVGGAYAAPEFFTGLSDHGRKSMADFNERLIKANMPVIREFLIKGTSSAAKGSGIIWDFNYVQREQDFLTEVIGKDPLSESDKNAVNNNFSRFEPLHLEYTLARTLLNVRSLDYLPQKQRMAIGRSLVFMKHMEDKSFAGSKDYKEAIKFLNKEYGKDNVTNFLETYKEKN